MYLYFPKMYMSMLGRLNECPGNVKVRKMKQRVGNFRKMEIQLAALRTTVSAQGFQTSRKRDLNVYVT